MIKRIMLSALLVVTLSGLTACTNSVSPVEKSVTSLTTTTMVEATVTTTPEQTTTPKVTTTVKPTTVTTTTKKKVTTTTPRVTTTKKATTTTKKPVVTTTTTKKKVTTTTTTAKKTTTKKPTTTTKKATTTTTKQEITKPQQTIKITQSDVDKLVAELQEYADKIFEEKSGYSPYDTEWIVQKGNGYWGTYEEHLAAKTPSNSSWSAPLSFNIYNDVYTYEYMLWYLKDAIDGEYNRNPDCHVVIYVEYFPNGFVWEGKQYTTYPCYTFWKLR